MSNSIVPFGFFDAATAADLVAQIEAGAASERDLAMFRAGLQAAGVADGDFYEAVDGRKYRALAKLLRHPRRQHYLLRAQFRLAGC